MPMRQEHKNRRLVLWIAAAFLAGVIIGLILNSLGLGAESWPVKNIFSPIASLYLNALKFIAIPVVFCSILSCVSDMADLRALGRIGSRVLLLFALTSLAAVGLGWAAFALLRPADGFTLIAAAQAYGGESAAARSWPEIAATALPGNILAPFIEGNMLQIIFIALLLGLGLGLLGERGSRLKGLVDDCYALFLRITSLIIALVPLPTFCAMARLAASTGADTLLPLLKLLGGIVAGMLALLLAYALLLMIARLDPRVFYRKWASTLLLVFSLNSATATVPITMAACRERLGIPSRICSLTIPVGATVNKDGTCVYLIMSALFLAQAYGVELAPADKLSLALSVFLLSAASPGISGAGLVSLSLLAAQYRIPLEGVGMLMGLDKLFGMMRSAVNVTGDVAVSSLVAAWEKTLDRSAFSAAAKEGSNDTPA